MAEHRAEQIMDAIVANLTGLTTTGANIERGRVYDWEESALPALSLFMGDDVPVELEDQTYGYIDHNLQVLVDLHIKNITGVESTLNKIKKEVTVALMADVTQGLSFVIDTEEHGFLRPDLSERADQPSLQATGTFVVKYRRSRDDPSA